MKLLNVFGGEQAIVDDHLFDRLNKFSWSINKGYARTKFWCPHDDKDKTGRTLHQVVFALNNQTCPCDTTYIEYGLQINHKNWNKLDNRLDNLELISAERNNQMKRIKNVSGYRGVQKHGAKWRTRIQIDGKCIHIGVYETETMAALKYNDYILAHKMDRELNPVNWIDWRDENIVDS